MSANAVARNDVAGARVEPPERDGGWLGVVLPGQSLELAPEIAGPVERIDVREGDHVRSGQIVAVIGAAQDRQELAIAEVNLRAAETEVAKSRLDLADADNRVTSRHAMPDAFAKEDIRRAEIQKEMAAATLEGARARVAAQQARVAQARDRVSKAAVRAPADGTVARRYVDPGALVGPGQAVVRLIGNGNAIVRFAASPGEAASLRTGVHVVVVSDSGELPAIVEWVSPEVDPPSGMLIAVAALDRTAAVKPGSVVRVRA
jgi:RND family efflux transporter MFP subunit